MCWIGAFGNPSWTVAWPFIAMFVVFKLAVWAAIVTMVVCGIRWLRRERHHGAPMGPVEILKARYARGELSKQDFESMRQDVERCGLEPTDLTKKGVQMGIDDAERERRRALLHAHYDVENDHDLDRIMATFSTDAEMLYNRQSFGDPESIRMAHAYIGLSSTGGAFRGIRNVIDHEHVTTDEVVVEGRLCGRHVGEFQGHSATERDVELPFVAFYRFGADGKLTSERVVMDLGRLAERA